MLPFRVFVWLVMLSRATESAPQCVSQKGQQRGNILRGQVPGRGIGWAHRTHRLLRRYRRMERGMEMAVRITAARAAEERVRAK